MGGTCDRVKRAIDALGPLRDRRANHTDQGMLRASMNSTERRSASIHRNRTSWRVDPSTTK